MSAQTLTDRYNAHLQSPKSGADEHQKENLCRAIRWLCYEFRNEQLLIKPEAVAFAKKLLNRSLGAEFTKSEVEEFLRG